MWRQPKRQKQQPHPWWNPAITWKHQPHTKERGCSRAVFPDWQLCFITAIVWNFQHMIPLGFNMVLKLSTTNYHLTAFADCSHYRQTPPLLPCPPQDSTTPPFSFARGCRAGASHTWADGWGSSWWPFEWQPPQTVGIMIWRHSKLTGVSKFRHCGPTHRKTSGAIPFLGLWSWGSGPRKMRHPWQKKKHRGYIYRCSWELNLGWHVCFPSLSLGLFSKHLKPLNIFPFKWALLNCLGPEFVIL